MFDEYGGYYPVVLEWWGAPQKGGGGALGNDMRGVAGTEGARPTNLAKDIFSGTSSSLLKFFRGGNFSGGFFLCVAWLCGMVKGKGV